MIISNWASTNYMTYNAHDAYNVAGIESGIQIYSRNVIERKRITTSYCPSTITNHYFITVNLFMEVPCT